MRRRLRKTRKFDPEESPRFRAFARWAGILGTIATVVAAIVGFVVIYNDDSSPYRPGELMGWAEVEALYAGERAWCADPKHRGGCLYAERAVETRPDGYRTEVLAIVAAKKIGERIDLTVRVFISDLVWRGDLLCLDPLKPLSAGNIGFYTTGGLKIDPNAPLRPGSDADFEAFRAGRDFVSDTCFRYRRSTAVNFDRFDQITYVDGRPTEEISRFTVVENWREIRLTMVE